MAATDVKLPVNYVIEMLFNKLDSIFSSKEEQTTARKAFVEWEDVFFRSLSSASPLIVAVIGCRPIQLLPEAYWSAPVVVSSLEIENKRLL